MSVPELSRPARSDLVTGTPREVAVVADADERAALARRFDLVAIDALTADVALTRAGSDIVAEGNLRAQVTQSCVVSGEPVRADVSAPFKVILRPEPGGPATADQEVELDEAELDVIFMTDDVADAGEVVAQTLALHLEPYPRAPGVAALPEEVAGNDDAPAGPFGGLAALRDKLGGG